eukprot:12776730-Heterocapsa_arctica.AAC.1
MGHVGASMGPYGHRACRGYPGSPPLPDAPGLTTGMFLVPTKALVRERVPITVSAVLSTPCPAALPPLSTP